MKLITYTCLTIFKSFFNKLVCLPNLNECIVLKGQFSIAFKLLFY